ncbi:FliO/MopB family protein [bacterium]|nr:FliO/MopB family protein [bacterium]
MAFIMIVGLGFIQNKDIPTFSTPVKSDKTGLDVFHEAARSIANPPDASKELKLAPDPKIEKIIDQADKESLNKRNKSNETAAQSPSAPAAAAPPAAENVSPQAAATPAPQTASPQAAATPAPQTASPQAAATPAPQTASPQAAATPEQQPQKPAKNAAGSQKKVSILDTPWPPSPDKEAPHVESTFFKRVAIMLVFLGVVCLLTWIVLKAAMPFIGKFTGNTVSSKNRLNIVERKTFGPNKSLMLLEVDGRNILLGITEENITSLSEWPCCERQSEAAQDGGKINAAQDTSGKETDSSASGSHDGSSSETNSAEAAGSEKAEGKPNLIKEVLKKHIAALPVPKFHKNDK